MLDDGEDPETVVAREDLGKTDDDAVADAVAAAIEENPEAVADYEDGDDGAINFLVGQVMGKTGGSADPGTVNEKLRAALEE
jgi:aspartyl-tRNA(Asn)/glutamyl-tRNA(Gln) amidotransferase subunit B